MTTQKNENAFSSSFDEYVCEGDTIAATTPDGFEVTAYIERDESRDRPDERNDGFWPSLNPGDAGYIGENPEVSFEEQKTRAEKVLKAWENDEWYYCGIVLSVAKPIMIDGRAQREVVLSEHAASAWGIECNYPGSKNEDLTEIANELLPEALEHAHECLHQISKERVVIEVRGGVAEATNIPAGVGVVIIDHDNENA